MKYLIFDLDGTLLNTLEDLCDSVNVVLRANSMKERNLDEIRSFVGNGIKRLIELSVEDGTSTELTNKCYEEMLAYYKEHSQIKTGPYEGVVDMLKNLKAKGKKIAVVTNKVQEAAQAVCDKYFTELIDVVIGDDKKHPLKPQPDNVYKALDILGASKEEAVYIGDSEVDVMTAKNSGLDFVAVSWGFRERKLLEEFGVKIVDKTEELEEELS
ncbi:MAG: HAD family hydrolase [Lachnospira sp.]|nr:HAD family hydrolase [Lachnospira sp.]